MCGVGVHESQCTVVELYVVFIVLIVSQLCLACVTTSWSSHCSPGGIPARNVKGERLLLFLGIIDILQSFRLKKKLEHTFKSMIHDGVRLLFIYY